MTYKLPRRPTAARVSVWRRLRRLGALRVHDAAWALPDTPWTREQAQWLTAEVEEWGGRAAVWLAVSFPPGGGVASDLRREMQARTTRAYRAILDRLRRRGADAGALARDYTRAREQDHFADPLAERVRRALLNAGAGPRTGRPRRRESQR